MNRTIVALAFVLAAAACAGDQPPAATPNPGNADMDPAIGTLPGGPCAWETSAGPRVTFAAGNRLYESRADGSDVRCLAEVTETARGLTWGPAADRVLVDGLAGILRGGQSVPSSDPRAADVAISHPTGKSVVYVDDAAGLHKRTFSGDDAADISFLTRHDAVAYHPAGTHIAVVGSGWHGEEEVYGIWLATNLGGGASPLAIGETAERLYDLSYGNDGTLFFAADHGDESHVHALRADEDGLQVLATMATGGDVVVSPFGGDAPAVAFRDGRCREGYRTRILRGDTEAGIGQARPLGWLSNDALLVVKGPASCEEGSGDLHVWTPEGSTFLVADVDFGAVRAAWPQPPPPPPVRADPPEA